MLDQNSQFKFITKEKNFMSVNHKKDSFFLVFKIIGSFFVCVSIGFVVVSNSSIKKTPPLTRDIQSLEEEATHFDSDKSIEINSFLVILKSKIGSQLTKVRFVFFVNNLDVLNEIHKSQEQITTHLIFILSDKNISILLEQTQRLVLKQDILTQLNSFLVSGKIKQIQIKETFLN